MTGRVVGVDLGDVRVGLAVSDPDARVATPHGVLPVGGLDEAAVASAVAAAVVAAAAARVVVGLPRGLDGRDGPPAQRARRVATALASATSIPVDLWDERFTTVEAERALKAQGLDGRQRRRVVDEVAATLLLQSYLDSRSRHPAEVR